MRNHRPLSLLPFLPAILAGCIIVTDGDGDTETSTTAPATESATSSPTSSDPDDTGVVDGTADSGQTANDRCDDLCDALVGAGCENGPTNEGCQLTCEALTSSASCDESAQAYMDCVEGTTVMCNAQGEPFAPGCGLLYLVAIGCAVNEDPNPEIIEPCADYCDGIATAACGAEGSVEDCNTNCLWLGATGTGCGDEWGQYVDCFNTADVSCVLGFAVAEGCGPDFDAYWSCINDPA